MHEHAGLRPFALHRDAFEALAEAAGERVRFTGLFAAGDVPEALHGFIVTRADVDQALGYHIGVEQAPGVDLPLSLRLPHASSADAIVLGTCSVSFGRTAVEPTSRLGCKPQAMQVWLRHRQPGFNQIVKRRVGFAHHAEAPDVNPLKKT